MSLKSLKSWTEEFYTPADRIPPAEALDHSIRKWTGLLPRNRQRHGVWRDHNLLTDGVASVHAGDTTCALCQCYPRSDCDGCPLCLVSDTPYCLDLYELFKSCGAAAPMLRLLYRAKRLTRYDAEAGEWVSKEKP